MYDTAVASMRNAFARFEHSSGALMDAVSGGESDVGAAIAGQIEATTQMRAAVSAIRTHDEMFGALLDIRA